MPITPRYDWNQDFESVSIQIHGLGFRSEQLQVADLYLGLNSAPYFLGLDLYSSIKSEECEIRLLSAALQIKLPKLVPGLWPELCFHADRGQLRTRRKQTIELARQKNEERRQQALQQKSDSKSKAQKRIWDDEDNHRSMIEQLKKKEESEAKADLTQWAESNENRGSPPAEKSYSSIFHGPDEQVEAVVAKPFIEVIEEPDNEVISLKKDQDKRVSEQKRRLPSVRSNPAVLVRFTAINDRAGPVARDPNEDDEFAVCPAISKATDDVTEGHAQLLYEKGLKFQRCNDYLSAISAFSSVLQVTPIDASALVNRARCYLNLASFHGAAITKKFERIRKCITDCNLALARSCAVKIHSDLLRTRAQANILLGNFPNAISDYEDAVNLSVSESGQELILELDQVIKTWNRRQSRDQVEDLDRIQDLAEIVELAHIHPCDINYLIRRAQIYSDLGQHLESIDDLTECLAIIDDPVLGRQVPDDCLDQTTARIYQLRGKAHLSLDHHWRAGDDFAAAIRHGLQPDLIQDHISSIQNRLAAHRIDPTELDSDMNKDKDPLQSLLESAATSFQQRDANRAKRLYSEALRLNPCIEVQAQILSNRAATELYLHQYDACIRDSASSLDLGNHDPIRYAITLSRRAAAYSGMGLLQSAEDDLKAALSLLEPGSKIAQQISGDLKRLTQYS